MSSQQARTSHPHSIRQQKASLPLKSLHLLYHELRPAKSSYSYVLECDAFARQVDLFVHLRQAEHPGLQPELTFDDGHISNYQYALPILHARGIQARFFITVGWTGHKPGYMGWEELRALHQAGQSIGAHGWTHALLTHCTGKDLQLELKGARHTLEDKLGAPITTLSLPGGRSNQRVLKACQEAGYTHVFTSVPRAEPIPIPPIVGRLNIRGDMTLDYIASLFAPNSSILPNLERQEQIKAAARTILGDRIYAKLWSLLNRQEPETNLPEALGQ